MLYLTIIWKKHKNPEIPLEMQQKFNKKVNEQ